MWPNTQETADLVTFTKEIFNGKLNFLCSVPSRINKTSTGISWEIKCNLYIGSSFLAMMQVNFIRKKQAKVQTRLCLSKFETYLKVQLSQSRIK